MMGDIPATIDQLCKQRKIDRNTTDIGDQKMYFVSPSSHFFSANYRDPGTVI